MIPALMIPNQFIAIAGARQVYDPAPAGGTDHILMEIGDDILLEDGTSFLLKE